MKGKRMRLYKRIASIALVLFMVVGLVPTMPVEVQAANGVSYVDYTWNEETQTLSSTNKSIDTYTVVTSSTTEMSNGWYVVNGNVTVAKRITVTGTVHLILADGAHLTAKEGISVNEGNALYIYGQSSDENTMGKLTATGKGASAVIGSDCTAGNSNECNYAGTIVINGGGINVTSSGNGAGIGSGMDRSGYDIVINAGKVTADASLHGAAIGSGPVQVSSIAATAEMRSIAIHGGNVTATSKGSGAAIGGGVTYDGGDITITGGTVTARATNRGAAIGGGDSKNGGNITITGGTITAENEGQYGAAGIGGGYSASGGTIIITGGTITAKGGAGAAGIGGGGFYQESDSAGREGGSITILTENVTAIKGENGVNDIGAGQNGVPGSTMLLKENTITVSGTHTLLVDYIIPAGVTLFIPDDASLTIPENVTLTISNGATVTKNGTITNNGTIECFVHVGVTHACNIQDTCTICGESYFKGHTSGAYSAEGNIITDSCTVCGEVLGKATLATRDAIYKNTAHLAKVNLTGTLESAYFSIRYTKVGETNVSTTAPTEVGIYKAELFMIDFVDVIASAEFSINYLSNPNPAFKINNGYEAEDVYWFGDGRKAIVEAPVGYTIADSLNSSFGESVSFSYDDTEKSIWLMNVNEEKTDKIDLTNILKWDVTAPTGSISIGSANEWDDLSHEIQFKHFFDEVQTFTISAMDTESGVASIEYYVANDLPENNIQSGIENFVETLNDWEIYSEPVSLPMNSKNVVYARVTDNVGNVTYISSEGIVLYLDSTVTSAANREYKAGKDLEVEYSGNGNSLAAILYKGQPLNNGLVEEYILASNKEAVTFKSTFLDALDAGTHEFTIVFHPQGVATNAVSLTETLTLTVTPAPLTIVGATATEKDYDGTKEVIITGLTLSGIKDTDIVGVSFENLTGGLSSANAGTYTSVTLGDLTSMLTLTGDARDNYSLVFTGGTVATDVTIEKIPATILTAPAANRLTYNTFAQTLVTAGVANGGTMMYSLSENGTYTEEIPTAANAGDYTVWYYVKGDGNHNDSAKASIAVNVEKATPALGTVFATIPDNSTEIDQIMLGCGVGMVDGNLRVDAGQSLVWGENEIAYTFTPVDTDNYNAVTGKVTVVVKDTIVPTVAYRIDTDAWKAFVNIVSFGLFCKDYKTVEIQATDNLSGIQKIEYFVADKKMTAEELADVAWETYTGSINLSATGKYIVYARVSDKAGNVTEEGISTEGIVIYEDSIVGSSAYYECNSGEGLHIEYFENGNQLKEILYNGQPLTHGLDGDYAMAATADVLSFMPAFLDTLEVGTYEFTFVFNPQGVETTAVSLTETFTLTVTPAPHIENEEGKMGWDAILDEVEDALGSDENTVVVDMNGFTEVPGDFFESIKGKDVMVEFDLDNGIVWTVNGKDITGENLEDIDFAVTISTEENPIHTIPVAVINKVKGENSHMEISLAHDGEFGFKAVLTINLDAENAGLFANLYYYNPTKQELEFICADEIAADGSADLTFTHASDYTIVIDEVAADAEEPEQPQEPSVPETPDEPENPNLPVTPDTPSEPENPSGIQPPNTGDSLAIVFWGMLLMAGFGLVVVGQRRRVR